jgi:hypothetical protein
LEEAVEINLNKTNAGNSCRAFQIPDQNPIKTETVLFIVARDIAHAKNQRNY